MLFEACFAKAALSTILIADHGVDTIPIPAKLLENIMPQTRHIEISTLSPPHAYSEISGEVCAMCTQSITLNVNLRIRQGSGLLLRNVVWKIPKEEIPVVILSGQVLESIARDNRRMLKAASERSGEIIEVDKELGKGWKY